MEKKKVISWESKHYEFNIATKSLQQVDEEKAEFLKEADEDDIAQMVENGEMIPVQQVMQTPFGLWQVDDAMNPFRQFKFWMGHTNFSIGQNAELILRSMPGVEVLKILTRYRFIIGVGELFDIRNVRTQIEEALCG